VDGKGDLFTRGVHLFNEQEYFECHEVLEGLWNRQVDPDKQFTQGLIQIAVGLYHLGRQNPVGAEKLLKRGLARVEPFAPVYAELDIKTFVWQVAEVLNDLQAGDAHQSAGFPTLVKSKKS
jgi:predicted metal-dependent hydrolase